MNPSPRIIFVNRFYWPDEQATAQLLTDLAGTLAAAGHEVHVVTSRPPGSPVPATDVRNGVHILRLASARLSNTSVLSKAVSFLSFARGALRELSKLLRPGDVLVLMTDPPLLNLPASSLAKKRGARLVHWIQDIYPEIAMAVGASWFAGTLRGRRDRAWRMADICVAPGEDMAGVVRERGVDPSLLLVSPNWAPEGTAEPPAPEVDALRREWNLAGKFIVMYSGNLGRVHDLDPVLGLAGELQKDSDIVFVFVGNGARKIPLQATAERRGLRNVFFKPAQARHRLGLTLAAGHVHLVTLRTGCERLVFPSKLYGVAAVGRPVLYIGPKQCEIARLVEARGFGRAFLRTEVEAAARSIRHLRHAPADCARMSGCARAFAASSGGLQKAFADWDRLLSGLKTLPAPTDRP